MQSCHITVFAVKYMFSMKNKNIKKFEKINGIYLFFVSANNGLSRTLWFSGRLCIYCYHYWSILSWNCTMVWRCLFVVHTTEGHGIQVWTELNWRYLNFAINFCQYISIRMLHNTNSKIFKRVIQWFAISNNKLRILHKIKSNWLVPLQKGNPKRSMVLIIRTDTY